VYILPRANKLSFLITKYFFYKSHALKLQLRECENLQNIIKYDSHLHFSKFDNVMYVPLVSQFKHPERRFCFGQNYVKIECLNVHYCCFLKSLKCINFPLRIQTIKYIWGTIHVVLYPAKRKGSTPCDLHSNGKVIPKMKTMTPPHSDSRK